MRNLRNERRPAGNPKVGPSADIPSAQVAKKAKGCAVLRGFSARCSVTRPTKCHNSPCSFSQPASPPTAALDILTASASISDQSRINSSPSTYSAPRIGGSAASVRSKTSASGPPMEPSAPAQPVRQSRVRNWRVHSLAHARGAGRSCFKPANASLKKPAASLSSNARATADGAASPANKRRAGVQNRDSSNGSDMAFQPHWQSGH